MTSLLNQYKSYLQGSRMDLQGRSLTGSRTDLKRNSRLQAEKGSPAGERSVLNGISKPLSATTIKNYTSDAKHFLTYLKEVFQEETILPKHITTETIKTYLADIASTSPSATLKRKLSSLKRFTGFLVAVKLKDTDPAQSQNLDNTPKNTSVSRLLASFTNYLKTEGLSNSTIKNYTSDLNHYLLWATKNNKLTDKHFNTR